MEINSVSFAQRSLTPCLGRLLNIVADVDARCENGSGWYINNARVLVFISTYTIKSMIRSSKMYTDTNHVKKDQPTNQNVKKAVYHATQCLMCHVLHMQSETIWFHIINTLVAWQTSSRVVWRLKCKDKAMRILLKLKFVCFFYVQPAPKRERQRGRKQKIEGMV